MKYHIYYFSATGNTEHSIGMIKDALGKAGHTAELKRLNRDSMPFEDTPDRLVLAFPTLAWSPPPFVMEFIRRLPRPPRNENPVKSVVLAVGGGGPKSAPDVAADLLDKRGYPVLIRAMANFTDNWTQVMSPPDGERRKDLNSAGDRAVSEFITGLIADKPWTGYRRDASFAMFRLIGKLYKMIGARMLGKMYIADDRCTSCGLCRRTCPVNAITMGKNGKSRPFWKFSCESCNRCINICPEKAINSSVPRIFMLLAAIGAALTFGVILYSRYIVPLYAGWPGFQRVLTSIAGYTAMVLAAHLLPLTLLDCLLLRPLQALKPVRRFLQISFTRKFNRYTWDGYRPPVEKLK